MAICGIIINVLVLTCLTYSYFLKVLYCMEACLVHFHNLGVFTFEKKKKTWFVKHCPV